MSEPARHSPPIAHDTDAAAPAPPSEPRLNPSRFSWITLAILLLPIAWLIYDFGPYWGAEKRREKIREVVFASSSIAEAVPKLEALGFEPQTYAEMLTVPVNKRHSVTMNYLIILTTKTGTADLLARIPFVLGTHEFFEETSGTITSGLPLHHFTSNAAPYLP